MAQALYRSLLRATRIAFTGDGRTLLAARQKIRHEFQQKASLSPSDPAFGKAIKYAQDVALILRHNVVQGQSDGNDLYKRGDNDSVKHSTSKLANKTGGCGCN
ncbi:Mitochondrial zinc maintenance protein 1, mitochondrial [Ceratocystis fimbriata CBS 114723]|uniref:Mitochondrial zinc maintenance protein 1, mitochondrial n=1 Tax=Ceratocystis fimbriata CBS 114723 TaxID=1035309 RepID=A0A2C5WV46_9PEZI|nr:Mitochondrial zinc maintenance protein 1, mitochondrial [Ceratocystis fimbriata CBS 114723]